MGWTVKCGGSDAADGCGSTTFHFEANIFRTDETEPIGVLTCAECGNEQEVNT